ncbi:GNAT family N-acetyltransferase [Salmonella enterica]|nr:GNAT family N-acetyltransferase [Salmonella enterica]
MLTLAAVVYTTSAFAETSKLVIESGDSAQSRQEAAMEKEQWNDTRSLRQKVNTRAEKEWDKADAAFDNRDKCEQSANKGKGLASRAAKLAMDYGFTVLNLYKLYLIVDKENEKAIHIYRKLGFRVEGELIHEFFINGEYRNTIRMCIFQQQYLDEHKTSSSTLLKPTAQ